MLPVADFACDDDDRVFEHGFSVVFLDAIEVFGKVDQLACKPQDASLVATALFAIAVVGNALMEVFVGARLSAPCFAAFVLPFVGIVGDLAEVEDGDLREVAGEGSFEVEQLLTQEKVVIAGSCEGDGFFALPTDDHFLIESELGAGVLDRVKVEVEFLALGGADALAQCVDIGDSFVE